MPTRDASLDGLKRPRSGDRFLYEPGGWVTALSRSADDGSAARHGVAGRAVLGASVLTVVAFVVRGNLLFTCKVK